jgi:hypothetical protein
MLRFVAVPDKDKELDNDKESDKNKDLGRFSTQDAQDRGNDPSGLST